MKNTIQILTLIALTSTLAPGQSAFHGSGTACGTGSLLEPAARVHAAASGSVTCSAISRYAPVGNVYNSEAKSRALVFAGGAFAGASAAQPYVLPLPENTAGASPDSFAYAINDAGLIAGAWTPADGISHAILWHPVGSSFVAEDLNSRAFPDWLLAAATGVNNRGQVVGWGSFRGSTHAFLITSETGISDLGTLTPMPYDHSIATGINDQGQVVGYSIAMTHAGIRHHAFLWSDGVMTDLGASGAGAAENSIATSINNYGKIDGFANAMPSASIAYAQNAGWNAMPAR